MEYMAILEKLDTYIEEEAIINVDNHNLTVFVNVCPFEIFEGNEYRVNIDIEILDDEFNITEISLPIKQLERIGCSFGYRIRGLLTDGIIDAGIKFELGKYFQAEYSYLDNKYIELKADRISVEFIT